MCDPSELLLYQLLHSPPSVSTMVVSSPGGFSPVVGAVYLEFRVEDLFERLSARGAIESAPENPGMFRIVPNSVPTGVRVLEAVEKAVRERGLEVELPARLRGKSGIDHHFDILAQREGTRLLIDIVSLEPASPRVRDTIMGYYAKITDVADSARRLLVVVPHLAEDGHRLAQAYGMDVVECADAAAAYSRIRARIEPALSEGLVPTGVQGLGPLLGGGFVEGRTYLLLGAVSSGKTTFAIQFLLDGAHRGQHGLLLTTWEAPADIVAHADRIGLDLREQVSRGNIVILNATPMLDELRRKGFNDPARYDSYLTRVLGELSTHISRLNATRIAIDTVTPLMPIRKYDEVRTFISGLDRLGRVTTLITEELGLDGDTALEEYFVSGVIVLRKRSSEEETFRTLQVQKQRQAPHDPAPHRYTIERGAGIVVQ